MANLWSNFNCFIIWSDTWWDSSLYELVEGCSKTKPMIKTGHHLKLRDPLTIMRILVILSHLFHLLFCRSLCTICLNGGLAYDCIPTTCLKRRVRVVDTNRNITLWQIVPTKNEMIKSSRSLEMSNQSSILSIKSIRNMCKTKNTWTVLKFLLVMVFVYLYFCYIHLPF